MTITVDGTITSPAPINAFLEVAITPTDPLAPAVTGMPAGASLQFQASGLPTGLTMDPATGVITGTPKAAASAAPIVITATDPATPGAKAVGTISVSVVAPSLSPEATTLAVPVNAEITPIVFTAGGFATPLTSFTLAPALPDGLFFTVAGDKLTVTGTPSRAWPQTAFTISASNADISKTATLNLSVTATDLAPRSIVGAVGTTITPTPAYAPADFTTAGLVGTPVLTITPALPAGLAMAASTGVISGKPTVAIITPTDYTITATDPSGASARALVTMTISPTQLQAPVVYFVQAGTTSGSLRVLFLGPSNAPSGQTYAAEIYDSTGATLAEDDTTHDLAHGRHRAHRRNDLLRRDRRRGVTGLPGVTVGPQDGTAALSGSRLTPPSITAISGGSTPGSISLSFNPTPNAPAGLTYTVQVYDEDQLTLVKSVAKATSPTLITGLTPGQTYFVIVAADATPTTLEALSRGRTVTASAQRGVATSVASAATISSTNPASASSTVSTALGAGWLRPTAAQTANAKRVAVAMRPSTKPAKAPVVKVAAKRVVALRSSG